MSEYPLGSKVTFGDDTATVSTGEPVVVSGRVNGEPLVDDEGQVVFVPVFAQRDKNREATTIFVNVHNVLGVDAS